MLHINLDGFTPTFHLHIPGGSVEQQATPEYNQIQYLNLDGFASTFQEAIFKQHAFRCTTSCCTWTWARLVVSTVTRRLSSRPLSALALVSAFVGLLLDGCASTSQEALLERHVTSKHSRVQHVAHSAVPLLASSPALHLTLPDTNAGAVDCVQVRSG